MKNLSKKENLLFFIPLIVIMIGSFFIMYQSFFITSIYHNHLFKQILWFLIGFIILLIIQKINLEFIINNSFYFYLFSLLLLILVLIFGKEVNGAKAWFNLKFLSFQPSELMKVALLLYLVKITRDYWENKKNDFKYLSKTFLILLIPSFLVFLEPDTGAIIIYLAITFGVIMFSKIKPRWFIILFSFLFLIICLLIYFYFFKQETLINLLGSNFFYRVDRLINYKNGNGLQLNNALITIGNAGFWGLGIQKNILYVPEFPTDFAFTLGFSLWGYLGSIIILFCYMILNYYFIKKIFKTKNYYRLFINGFFGMFIFQQIENIGMNLGLLPIMGIPLPFLSYGGSNMIIYFIIIGIILAIK